MMNISNVKILYKILACFVLLGLVVGGAIWFTVSKMNTIDHDYSAMFDHEVQGLKAGIRANLRVYNFGRLSWRLIAEDDIADMNKTIDEINANYKEFQSQIDLAKKYAPDFAIRFEQARQTFEAIGKEHVALEKAALANNNAEALRLGKTMMVKTVELRNSLVNISEDLDKAMHAKADHESAETKQTIIVTIVSITIALVIVLALAFAIVQIGIARPIAGLVVELKKLAAGDFNVSLSGLGRKDEIGQIAEAAEMVAERVGSTISTIKLSANEVTGASAEISSATTDLSQRTEEQAASLEETSASMEEISATVKKNAENAQQANQLANETHTVAERGGAIVGDAVNAMARIEESSRKISDIIGVIDEIARQTNLLALNAAVEAARAGEAGRGFAVVATEVRSLAQRSSQAAKDIKDLITNSSGQVQEGVELVNRAGASLNEIVESIKKVTAVVSDIANASIEQSSGIEQINKALTQMDEVTQQNSALVEENAATAKTLEQQAKAMDERVAFFRLRGGAGNADFARPAAMGEEHAAPRPAPKAAAAVMPKRPPAVAPKRVVNGSGGGPARRMQTALATAVQSDPDWKEF